MAHSRKKQQLSKCATDCKHGP